MPTFFMTIGVPGSGKSSCVEKAAAQMGATVVCPDEIRLEITGSMEDQSQNQKVWELARSRIKDALADDHDVILDSTANDVVRRREMISYVRGLFPNITVVGVVFDVSLKVAIERNQNRDRKVPEHVIYRMGKNLFKDPPSKEDGFTVLVSHQTWMGE